MSELYGYAAASATLAHLADANRRLAELMPRIRSANEAFSEAAQPLIEQPELDSNEKKLVALKLRAAERECEDVAQLTTCELENVAQLCGGSPPANAAATGKR